MMSNYFYNEMQGQAPGGFFDQLMADAQQLKKTLTNNPKQEVERLLQSGQMTQQQFNQFSQIAMQVLQRR